MKFRWLLSVKTERLVKEKNKFFISFHRYTDNVVGPLLSAQMYNPEFDWTSSVNTQDNNVAEVIDKLRHIRQVSAIVASNRVYPWFCAATFHSVNGILFFVFVFILFVYTIALQYKRIESVALELNITFLLKIKKKTVIYVFCTETLPFYVRPSIFNF